MHAGHFVQLTVSRWWREVVEAWRVWYITMHHAYNTEAALQSEYVRYEALVAQMHELEAAHQAQLLELQPFAELGRIGASMVHELTNPLTAALLCAEEVVNEYPGVTARQTLVSLRRVERYLLAARKQIKRESDLRYFSVGSELRQVVGMLRPHASKVQVQLEVGKIPKARLYGDVVKFAQIVTNIIDNAIDVAGHLEDRDMRRVVIRVLVRGGVVTISVTDYGAPIARTQVPQLFKPFYSSKGALRAGLGIGLALVKEYVEQDFSGDIKVRSSRYWGTTFVVRLRNHNHV